MVRLTWVYLYKHTHTHSHTHICLYIHKHTVMESRNCSADVAASDSADEINNYDSVGLEIVGGSSQRYLVERDGMLELLGQQCNK